MPPLARATVTTLFLLCTTRAMELEERDHSESWAAAGLVDQFAVTYAQALPDALLAEVEAALPSLKPRQVPFGDGRTIEHNWWLQLYDGGGARNSPKSSVEVALHALYDLAFGGAKTDIIGCEWWYRDQEVGGQEFHFDKDEVAIHAADVMRHPDVTTVTYLSSAGAPTVVLNQTIGYGAAEMEPRLAREGLVVHPQRNTPLAFRGNLHHGVVAALAPRNKPPVHAERRRVLLINWWAAPAVPPPVCMPLDTAAWLERGLLRDAPPPDAPSRAAPPFSEDARDGHAVGRRHPAPLAEASAASLLAADASRVPIEVGGSAVYHYPFPPPPTRVEEAASWLVRWPPGVALGPLTRLRRGNLEVVLEDPRPKLFLLVRGAGRLWIDVLPRWLAVLHARYEHALQVVLAEPSVAGMILPPLRHNPNADGARKPTAIVLDGDLRAGPSRRALYDLWHEGASGEAALERLVRDHVPQKEEL